LVTTLGHRFKPLQKHQLWDGGIEFSNQGQNLRKLRALQQADGKIID
jgi:hypothetical protein